jgi:prepilin-type N-terminal cleavage/methylation domain-containing protein
VSNLLKKDKGFTLIEIVLVLAIAGLLLVIVFLALSGAQKSRRDTARKNDAARMLAAIESCASNGSNAGSYALCQTGAQLITGGYFSGTDPAGAAYTAAEVGTTAPTAAKPFEIPGTCTGTATMSVSIYQEAGAAYCIHN